MLSLDIRAHLLSILIRHYDVINCKQLSTFGLPPSIVINIFDCLVQSFVSPIASHQYAQLKIAQLNVKIS